MSNSEPMMNRYRKLDQLKKAYLEKLELDGMSREAAELNFSKSFKYVPHLYRGGYVIPGFGYTEERLARVKPERAGNPYLVK